jgi:hypothetical protein
MIPFQELLTRYSTWVVALLCSAAAYWLQLTPGEQQALLASYPWLAKAAPAAGFVTFLAARGVKQSDPEKKEQ